MSLISVSKSAGERLKVRPEVRLVLIIILSSGLINLILLSPSASIYLQG